MDYKLAEQLYAYRAARVAYENKRNKFLVCDIEAINAAYAPVRHLDDAESPGRLLEWALLDEE